MTRDDNLLYQIQVLLELAGRINTQAAGQLYSNMVKDAYFLVVMKPAKHMLHMRLILHQNQKRNGWVRENVLKSRADGTVLQLSEDGRLRVVFPDSTEVAVAGNMKMLLAFMYKA
jgi:hypothetical protein